MGGIPADKKRKLVWFLFLPGGEEPIPRENCTHLGVATGVLTVIAFGEPSEGLSTWRVVTKRRERAPVAHRAV